LDKCQYRPAVAGARRRACDIAMDFEFLRLTHPLPQVVLTFIQQGFLIFEAQPNQNGDGALTTSR
jgi:hypothetical protein